MPDKEGAQEKSTTKEVVNKKQKQMMGEEGYDVARDEGRVKPSRDKKDGTSYPPSEEMKKTQKKNKGPSAFEIVKKKYGKSVMDVKKEELDLTKVAESFGGEIIGEPIELDEGKLKLGTGLFTYGSKAYKFLKSKPGRKTFQQFVDLGKKYKGKVKTFFDRKKAERIFNKSKNFEFIGNPDGYTRIPKPPIKEPFKPLKPLKDFIKTGTEKAKTQFQKIKDTFKKKKTKKDTSYDLSKDYNVSGNKNKSKIGTTTKVAGGTGLGLGVGTLIGRQTKKKGAGGKFRPRLPQTSHNIGRTSNPQ